MARKIRFPLKMKNGAEVRTLDELKENFDLESVLGYFTDGKLATWLADRYYDDKAAAVRALTPLKPITIQPTMDLEDYLKECNSLRDEAQKIKAKLCKILEVEYEGNDDETDFEHICRRNEKYRLLSELTDDSEILDNIDIVALNNDDVTDIRLYSEVVDKIYLYGERFTLSSTLFENVCFIGIGSNMPIISFLVSSLNDFCQ